MTIDFAADLNELLSVNDHGYWAVLDDGTEFQCILNRVFMEQVTEQEPAVGGYDPGMYAKTADVSALAEGDRVRFFSVSRNGTRKAEITLVVATEHEPDGEGLSFVDMREA